jgi:hypothetical protein
MGSARAAELATRTMQPRSDASAIRTRACVLEESKRSRADELFFTIRVRAIRVPSMQIRLQRHDYRPFDPIKKRFKPAA